MAKIRINLPERFIFSTEIPIYISFINYGGHLGHDAVLTLVHEARLRFLKEYGYSELDIEGAGIIVADAAVVYKAEAFHGDIMVVELAFGEFGRHGFELLCRMSCKATGREVARVKLGIVCFDYARRSYVKVPEAFRSRWEDA